MPSGGGGGNVMYNTINRGVTELILCHRMEEADQAVVQAVINGGNGGNSVFDNITASGLDTRGMSSSGTGGNTTANISGTSTTYTGGTYPGGGGAGSYSRWF